MSIPARDRKKLWAWAKGCCSICREEVSETGEEAHIVARQRDGPRGDDPLPLNLRDGYENRILLCPTCHSLVDGAESDKWPVERLRQVKAQHEEWARQTVERVTELAGIVKVTAVGGDDVAGARIRKPTIIKPGTVIDVDALGAKRVSGVEIGGSGE